MAPLVTVFASVALFLSVGAIDEDNGSVSDGEGVSSEEESESSEEESLEEVPKVYSIKTKCPPEGIINLKMQLPNRQIREIQYATKVYEYCNCTEGGETGQNWTATNDEECLVTIQGYNGELTQKEGKCKDGICQYTEIPRGCRKDDLRKEPDDGVLPIGCAFTCTDDAGRKQYGYYKNGTNCQHYENEKYINTTCKLTTQGMRCWQNVPHGMAC